ncbi:hypothetical protein NDN08_005133 [Rhodosorus marinus]|uniref:Pentacotripeptide-repeat region of PRORP domain-containing protein n=1 Tax=Rhodosorus marinus TaxID=101924 RepID=A0AAV8V2E8_9RHOD|nr:hypothetical protein NDN08_005133 [Rhodosorus marinus]
MSSRELVKGWERSSGLRPFERTKKSILQAFNVFNSRLKKGYIGRDIEVARVTEGLASYGDFRRVAYTMLEVEGHGREPLDQCYGHWIRSLARGDQVDRVRSVIDHMRARNRDVPLSVYNEALFALGKNGRVKECLLIKEELDKELRKLDDVTYTALINSAGESQRMKLARKLWNEMLARRVKPEVQTFGAYMRAHVRCEDYKGAAIMYEVYNAEGRKTDRVSDLQAIIAYGQMGEVKKATEVYQIAERRYKNRFPKQLDHAMIQVFVEADLMQAADMLFKKIKYSADIMIFNTMFRAYAKQGKLEDFENLMTYLENETTMLPAASTKEAVEMLRGALERQGRMDEKHVQERLDELRRCVNRARSGRLRNRELRFMPPPQEPPKREQRYLKPENTWDWEQGRRGSSSEKSADEASQ